MISDKIRDNERAIEAAADPQKKKEFLTVEKAHILRLSAVILKRRITDSDDEWSIALIAVSDAIDNYSRQKGDFWGFAAVVVRNRLYDYLRKEKRIGDHETRVAPEAFSGEYADDTETAVSGLSVVHTASRDEVSSDLREEIRAFSEELSGFDITIRELSTVSPRSQKTKKECGLAVAAIFLPPPLYKLLIGKKKLPLKEIEERSGVKRKLLDRHRKYIIAAALIFGDDYPMLREYFPNN